MQTILHAAQGDTIAVSIEHMEPNETVYVFCLDSEQRHLAEPWLPGKSATFMPQNRALLLTADRQTQVFSVPHEDDWLVVADAKPDQNPKVTLLSASDQR
jgi:hypothetical protein